MANTGCYYFVPANLCRKEESGLRIVRAPVYDSTRPFEFADEERLEREVKED